MKIGIMQPYFLPYIGYWQLMNAVDRYVVYDDVNYIKRGWINRNRILVNGEPRYINIRIVDASQNRLIRDTRIDRNGAETEKSLRTVEQAYKKAPCFRAVYPLVEEILTFPQERLVDFLLHSFRTVRAYLGIETELLLSSEIEKDGALKGQEKILSICRTLGADQYYNAIGGRELYSFREFERNGIRLSFLETQEIVYKQYGNPFQSNLSILDVMMFNSREQVREMLGRYRLISE